MSHPPDSDQAIKMCRRTSLTEKLLKEICDEEVEVFTDKCSEEIEEGLRNAASLKCIFEIVPSRVDGNCLFHILNNIVFGCTRNIEDLRKAICNYIIFKKEHFIGS